MTEVWKPITDFEGYYEVSNLGRIRSMPNPKYKGVRVRVLTPDHQGYLQITLCKDKGRAQKKVHLLVAEAFHGPRPEGLVCRHLDGDNTNNQASNLRWGTEEENVHDKVKHGSHRGANNGAAKLDDAKVVEIKLRLRDGARGASLAREFGVSQTAITYIAKGKRWTHVTI